MRLIGPSLALACLLLAPPLRAASAPTLSDLDAALREAAALTIPGLAPGERQTKRREDGVLKEQLKARNAAVERAEALGAALLAGASAEQQMAVRVRLGWLHLDLAEAFVNSGVPSYLTEEQREIYAVAMEDRAELQVREARAHAAGAVVLARGAPEALGAGAVWSLWAVVGVQDRISLRWRCPVSPALDRSVRQSNLISTVTRDLAHLSADLEAYSACLPPDLLEAGQMLVEQGRAVMDEQDYTMVGDLASFFDELLPPIDAAIVERCGVAEHPVARPPPEPAVVPSLAPLDAPLSTLPALDVALQEAAQLRAGGLKASCAIDLNTRWAQTRPGAMAGVEQRAAPLLASDETHTAAALALAGAYAARAKGDWRGLPPTLGDRDEGAQRGLLAAVAWMAARADRLLLDVLGDPAATASQRAQALSLQADLQSWLPHVAAELNEAAGCR